MIRQDRSGQSTFEYILLVAAVIVVLIVFLNPNGFFRNAVEGSLNKSIDRIGNLTSN